MRMSVSRVLATLTLAVLSLPASAAPAAKGESKSDKVSAAEAIRKALDSTNTFEFTGVQLPGVLNTLSEQYKINIVLDQAWLQQLQQMGLAADQMMVEVKKIDGKLRQALRAIVGQHNLTFVIVEDSLLVTTEEMAVYRQLKQRISVDFEAVPLQKAVKELSAKYGVNVVVDPRAVKSKAAENPVTLQVDDVPFEAAVRLMCEMADLKPARMGNVIFVTTEARADKLKDSDALVPTPGLPTPGLIPGLPGGLGGLGGAAVQNPAVAVPPPVADKPPPVEEKTEAPKKEEPKKP
jgi:type II secretory pathway component GspD/PulD (secretin)